MIILDLFTAQKFWIKFKKEFLVTFCQDYYFCVWFLMYMYVVMVYF